MPCAERNKLRLARYMNADFKIETSSVLEQARQQLDEYFAGIRILIPCHRIIGSNRSLTGFAGGLEAKRILLELETEKS